MTKKERYEELKRLFKPDTEDELWKLQNHIHDLTWKLYDSCGMHHVSTEKGIDIYMLVEKEYPLSRGTLTLMLVAKLLVDQDNEMYRELLRKIFMQLGSADAEGIECLPNADIFEQLALMGMVKNVDSSVKFLMYPRFVQVFLDKQVGDMSTHDEIFVTPSHTKKVFGNMKRVRKGFSRAVTPLFPTIMVQAQEEMGEEPIADEVANEENVPTQSNDPPLSRVNTLRSGEDRLKLKELMDLCTKLSDRVLDLETTKTTQAKEIASLKKRVKKLERKRKSKTPGMKRLFKIGRSAQVVSFEDKEQSEKVVEEVVSTAEVNAAATITIEEITLAQALAELRSAKPKVVVQEPVHVKRGRDTKIPQSSGPLVKVGDETVHKELGDRMERAATTASSLEAEQYSGNIK
ncbi:hypothetical protein Tco_1494238 [Tanacetum coccineum]